MSRQATPTLALTLILAGTVTADRFVTPAGAQTGADGNALGVATIGGTIGDRIAVTVLGTATVEVGAAVTAGATVKADASGRAIPWATSGARLGSALQAATAAGQFVEVFLIPNAA
jgi:hypothetical protein